MTRITNMLANGPMRARLVPGRTALRRAALAVGIALVLALALRWWVTHWRPSPADWPMQGVAVGAANAPVRWAGLASQGANFAYIDATTGANGTNAGFTAEQGAARAAGLRVGAIHHFALCALASEQAASFVRLVPRDADALPPAVMLDVDPHCARHPTRALLLSELSTFLNQVETHMGKAAIIAPSADFEQEYSISSAINRAMWLRRTIREPDVDGPPWVMWQANDALRIDGSTGPTRWLVLHDGGPRDDGGARDDGTATRTRQD
ncbi:MAG: GH25 family lysozyme [Sphingopyxis sp.]